MKKTITIFLLFILTSTLTNNTAWGQADGEGKDRIQAAKVAFISTKLNLTTTQAQQFWPLFNEFETARKRIRKQIRQLRIDNLLLGGNDEELKTDIRKLFALRQEELDLDKTYAEKFLKVLTPKQLVEYYRLEKEFTKVLLRRLKGKNNPEPADKDE